MVLVQANNQNARTDNSEYGQGMYYDTLSDSASNLYNWWMEQYFPENLQNIDKYQTNYDTDTGSSDNRRTYDASSSENYNEYSGWFSSNIFAKMHIITRLTLISCGKPC